VIHCGAMASRLPEHVTLRYDVSRVRPGWELSEETVPESRPHDLIVELLKSILTFWASRTGRSMQVGRNLAVRWDELHPKIGADPDVYVVEPAPPEGDAVTSLCTWKPGHVPPQVAVEVVSPSNATKDYVTSPERYAAAGVLELWIFDAGLEGPSSHGGPFRLQVWRRQDDGGFTRAYAGAGPAWSRAVEGWLCPIEGGARLRIADDPEGTTLWKTAEEAERAEKETLRAKVAELEEALRQRR
jgi:Uma2 family endonuclease